MEPDELTKIKHLFERWASCSKEWINHDAGALDIFAAGFKAGQNDLRDVKRVIQEAARGLEGRPEKLL